MTQGKPLILKGKFRAESKVPLFISLYVSPSSLPPPFFTPTYLLAERQLGEKCGKWTCDLRHSYRRSWDLRFEIYSNCFLLSHSRYRLLEKSKVWALLRGIIVAGESTPTLYPFLLSYCSEFRLTGKLSLGNLQRDSNYVPQPTNIIVATLNSHDIFKIF